MAAYSASKAGVIGLAKGVGKEYAETGITVNALAPAVIRTGSFTSIQSTNKLFLFILLCCV
jgi:NAD(P)-dependent dehydrogenase (short-subunit alcohol dehydrogenase family)